MTTQTISDLGHEPSTEFRTAILSALLAQGLSIDPVTHFKGELYDGQEDWAFVELDYMTFDVNYWIDDSTFHITAYPSVCGEDGQYQTIYSTYWRILTQSLEM